MTPANIRSRSSISSGPAARGLGFTAVELLIVVAILGILATIIIPAMTYSVTKSRATSIVAEARILRDAVIRYEIDAGGPLGPWFDVGEPPELYPYTRGQILYLLPRAGLSKFFFRLEEPVPFLRWQTIYLIRADHDTYLIELVRDIHDGAFDSYIPGRQVGLILD